MARSGKAIRRTEEVDAFNADWALARAVARARPSAVQDPGEPGPQALTIDTTGIVPPNGFIIVGDDAGEGDALGFAVASAGDVNGDGFDDIIIGASGSEAGGPASGAAYVIFGKASGFGNIDLTGIESRPQDGFKILGSEDSLIGPSVGSADFNNDGYSDLIIGGPRGFASEAGVVYVVFGKAAMGTVNLAGIHTRPQDGFRIDGAEEDDRAGTSVSSAGDVNGDGFEDLIIGAPRNNNGGLFAGEAYVVFGKSTGIGTIELADLAAQPQNGFVIRGKPEEYLTGTSVAAAGDVNGDGFDDLIVGAPGADFETGEAYVIFGKAGGFSTIDLTGLAPADGFVILGKGQSDLAGISVGGAGDINGDGFDEVIVGARDAHGGRGAAYVIFGKASGFGTIDLEGIETRREDGFVIRGEGIDEDAGASVAMAGDFNGDGYDDMLIGAPSGDNGGALSGQVYLIFGKAAGFGTIELPGSIPGRRTASSSRAMSPATNSAGRSGVRATSTMTASTISFSAYPTAMTAAISPARPM